MVKLEEITRIQAPIERCFDLARSVEVHLAGNVHSGEQTVALEGVSSGLIDLGQHVTWRARHFGVAWTLTSAIAAMDRPGYFQDAMTRGPFGSMKHDHLFRSLSADETEMTDLFWFSAPLGLLGRMVESLYLASYMRGLLRERNRVLQQIAESPDWRKYLP